MRYTFARNGLRQTWHGVVTHERRDGTVLVRWTEFPKFDLLFPAPACALDTPISIWIQRIAPTGERNKAGEAKFAGGDVVCAVGHRTATKKPKNGLEKVLVTWNCRSARAPWRIRELETGLLRRGADGACLQETRWRVKPTFKEYEVAAWAPCDAKGKGGNVILVRRTWVAKDAATGNAGTLLAVTIGEGKNSVRVIGAHAPHSAIDAAVRGKWWVDAAAFWKANWGRGVPTIGLGDFNATLVQAKGRTLGQKENKGSECLDDFLRAFDLVAANGIFTKPARRLVTFVGPKMRLAQLDAVLVGNAWKSCVRDVRNFPMPFPSDHVPLEVRVRVKFAVKKREAVGEKVVGPRRVDWSALTYPTPQILSRECLWLEAVAAQYGLGTDVGQQNPKNEKTTQHVGVRAFVPMLDVTVAEEFTRRVKENLAVQVNVHTAACAECLRSPDQELGMPDVLCWVSGCRIYKKTTYSSFSKAVAAASDAVPTLEKRPRTTTPGPYEVLREKELRSIRDLKTRFDAIKRSYDDEEDARVKKCVDDFERLGKVRPGEAWKSINELLGHVQAKCAPTKSSPEDIVENFRKVNGLPNHARPPDFRKRCEQNIVDVSRFRMVELDKAVGQLRIGRAFGIDGVPSEVLRLAGFRELLLQFAVDYQGGDVPLEVLMTRLSLVPKKGDLTVIANYRPIAIISVFLKLVNRMLLNRLRVLDPLLRSGQNGFRAGRGTTEHALALRVLAERAKERGLTLCTLFIDSQKAFDSVTFAALRASLESFMVPTKFIDVVMSCYNGHVVRVPMPDGSYESYTTTTGVLQGDTLAPFLFVVLLDSILTESMDDTLGIPLDSGRRCSVTKVHTDRHGQEIGGMRLRTGTKSRPETAARYLSEMAFADDLAFVTLTTAASEKQLHAFETVALACGLKINTSKGKTEVVLVNVTGEVRSLVTPAVVTCVEKYTYLGTDPFDSEGQFRQRKGKAWGAIKKLDTFWSSKSVDGGVKRQLFQSIVESVFTYGAVCWPTTVYWRDRIDRAYTSMLRYCLKTGEEEYDLYIQGGTAHLSSRIAYTRLMTVGHALRHGQSLGRVLMSTFPLPRVGRKLTLEKQIEKDVGEPDRKYWTEMAADRGAWRQRAREIASDNEERIYGRLLNGKRRRWCDVKRVETRTTLAILESAPTPRRYGPAPRTYVWWGHETEKRQHWDRGRWVVTQRPAGQAYVPAVPWGEQRLIPYRIKQRQHAFEGDEQRAERAPARLDLT